MFPLVITKNVPNKRVAGKFRWLSCKNVGLTPINWGLAAWNLHEIGIQMLDHARKAGMKGNIKGKLVRFVGIRGGGCAIKHSMCVGFSIDG